MHPQANAVRNVLQTYFDSINTRDYKKWSTVVSNARRAAQPYDTWNKGVRSSKDGSILVYRIDALSDQELSLLVGFTSTQDPSAAPADLPAVCVQWKLTLPLVLESNHWKVGPTAGNSAEYARC